MLETLELSVTGVGVVVPVKVVSPITLTEDSDARAAVIDAGSAERGTGPMYPPPPAESELLPGLLFTVVKPDAVLVLSVPPLDADWPFDPELALLVPLVEPEPVGPAPAEPMPLEPPLVAPVPVDPVPVEPLPLDLVPAGPVAFKPMVTEPVLVKPLLVEAPPELPPIVEPPALLPGQSLVTVTVIVTVSEPAARSSRIGDPGGASRLAAAPLSRIARGPRTSK